MKHLATALALGAAMAAFALSPAAVGQESAAPAPRGLSVGQSLAGELSQNDTQRRSGKYEDVYLAPGPARRARRPAAAVDAFDPYLVVTGPAGFNLSNDDEEGAGESTDSRLVLQLPADGDLSRLGHQLSGRARPAPIGCRPPCRPPTSAVTRSQPATPIRLGQVVTGRLPAVTGSAPGARIRITTASAPGAASGCGSS